MEQRMTKKMRDVLSSPYPKDSIYHKDHADHNKPGFLVRATAVGQYDCALREPGDVFRIKYARWFSESWMEKIDEAEAKKPRRRPQDDGERGARPASRDPEERAAAMTEFDKMVEQIQEDEKDSDVI